jgi:branched-chain amino acid:cation transporter, LIVCS family
MKKIFHSHSLSLGFAMFAMFFGAGNVIFPLALGQYAGNRTFYSIIGLIVSAVVIPMTGLIAMILYQGNTRLFFGRIGKIPGFCLALLIVSLLGPFGSAPRCIAVSFSTFQNVFPGLSLPLFSAAICALIFLCTVKKRLILSLLGWVLTPLLLISLFTIIVLGLITAPSAPSVLIPKTQLFLHGLQEGYNTMDLLAAFFFSTTLLSNLKKQHASHSTFSKATLIGALLLSATYVGFSAIAAFHSASLSFHSAEEILGALTMKIAGPYAGMLVCITISLACFTTAIALVSAFTDFFHKEVFREKLNYPATLFLALLVTFFVSIFKYTGISAFLTPVLQLIYPGLIILTLFNIWKKFKQKGVVHDQL